MTVSIHFIITYDSADNESYPRELIVNLCGSSHMSVKA